MLASGAFVIENPEKAGDANAINLTQMNLTRGPVKTASCQGRYQASQTVCAMEELRKPTIQPMITAFDCAACGSQNLGPFTAGIAVHFSGLRNLDKPHVYISTKLLVCLDCGIAQFIVPAAELRLFAKRDAAAA